MLDNKPFEPGDGVKTLLERFLLSGRKTFGPDITVKRGIKPIIPLGRQFPALQMMKSLQDLIGWLNI